MWQKPPELIEEAVRALVLLGTILASFLSLKLIAFGLPLPQRFPFMAITLLAPMSVIVLVLCNPKLRAERRYAEAIAEELPPDQKFTVRTAFLREEIAYGQDAGVLTLSGGCLHFQGLATSFSIPRSRIQVRTDAQPASSAKISLLFEVDGDPIGIDFWDHRGRVIPAPLLESLDGFWKTPSAGDFVPPPTSAQVWAFLSRVAADGLLGVDQSLGHRAGADPQRPGPSRCSTVPGHRLLRHLNRRLDDRSLSACASDAGGREGRPNVGLPSPFSLARRSRLR